MLNKNYGLQGVSSSLEIGKDGPLLTNSSGQLDITSAGGLLVNGELVNKEPTLVENATLALTFTEPTVYCTSYNATTGRPSPITGTIVGKVSYTNAKRGIIQTIYHDGSSFAVPSEWKLVGLITAVNGSLNRISVEYIHDGSSLPHVQYWVSQVAS